MRERMEDGDKLELLLGNIEYFNTKQSTSILKTKRRAATHKRKNIREALDLVTSHRVSCWRAGHYACSFDDALKDYFGTHMRHLVPDLFQKQSCREKIIQVQQPSPPRNLTRMQCISPTLQRTVKVSRALTFPPNKVLVTFPLRHTSACRESWTGTGPHYCTVGCMVSEDCNSYIDSVIEIDEMSLQDPILSETVVDKCGCGNNVVSLFAKAVKANFGTPVTYEDKARNIKNVIDCIKRKYKKRKISTS